MSSSIYNWCFWNTWWLSLLQNVLMWDSGYLFRQISFHLSLIPQQSSWHFNKFFFQENLTNPVTWVSCPCLAPRETCESVYQSKYHTIIILLVYLRIGTVSHYSSVSGASCSFCHNVAAWWKFFFFFLLNAWINRLLPQRFYLFPTLIKTNH